ncbi:hypothetical protein [Paenibacillus kobensis]|uniref:hypothetical protein n=1 Tax=Paenibacillus kobensis TaxID=59841 RepID=UPI000FD9E478|nr:hypothetical protein [Paenibacillus kobensis]
MSGAWEPTLAGQPEQLLTVVSVAVRPFDAIAPGGTLVGDVTVRLAGAEKPPIRNRSGWYIYTGLKSGDYTVHVESEYYMGAGQTVTVPPSAESLPVTVDLPLFPKPSYPFASHLTLIRTVVQRQASRPAEGAAVRVDLFEPESSYSATLAAAADLGAPKLKLAGVGLDAWSPGSVLLLKDTQAGRLEYVRLAPSIPANAAAEGYPLAEPVRYPHQAGTSVYAVKPVSHYEVLADSRGEAAIPVARVPLSRGFVALTVSQDGYATIHRDIQCEEGRTASLGILTLLSI